LRVVAYFYAQALIGHQFRDAAEKLLAPRGRIGDRHGSLPHTVGGHSLSIAALDLAREAPRCNPA